MLHKGFTIIELVIAIFIVGVLSTLGLQQYEITIRKSRDAEVKSVIGHLRDRCAALYMIERNTRDCSAESLRIGAILCEIPSVCRGSHYFRYAVEGNADGATDITFVGIRCTENGKDPQGKFPYEIKLYTDFFAGTDNWSGAIHTEK